MEVGSFDFRTFLAFWNFINFNNFNNFNNFKQNLIEDQLPWKRAETVPTDGAARR